jgi:hypothetical protein
MLTGWKTVIFSLVVAVIGVLQTVDWTSLLSDPKRAGIVVTIIGVVSGVLRYFTSTPIGEPN